MIMRLRFALYITTGVLLFIMLYLFKIYNYLLFHTVSELFSVVIAFSIFILLWNSRQYIGNHFFIYLGFSFLFVAAFDLLHTLAYKGMNIFYGSDTNLATQIWIAARSIQSFSILISFAFIKRPFNHKLMFTLYSITSLVLLALIYYRIFPDCFIEGKGLTLFKIICEYLICAILLISVLLLIKNRSGFNEKIFRLLLTFIIVSILSELSFTLYSDVYGISNAAGHYLKIVSFYFLYLSLIVTGYRQPYDLIFRELKNKEKLLAEQSVTDELTGIFNRRAAYDILKRNIHLAKRNNYTLSVCYIDLDRFKKINDIYGHQEGDYVLKHFSQIVKEEIRDTDYLCRLGGDELLIIFPHSLKQDIEIVLGRIKSTLDKYNNEKIKEYKISFSYGITEYDHSGNMDIDTLIRLADERMYRNKNSAN